MVTVYSIPHSPYSIPIITALTALGAPHRVVNLPPSDRSAVIKLTQGAYWQVPALEHDGKAVIESGPDTVEIARHVDAHWGHGRLFPRKLEGLQTILVRYIERDVEDVTFRLNDPGYVDSLTDLVQKCMLIRYKERKYGPGCLEQWRAQAPRLLAEAEQLLRPFEQMLGGGHFLLGDEPVYTDFALHGVLHNLTFSGQHEVPVKLRHVRAWWERLKGFQYPKK